MKVLVVCPFVPWPLDSGGRIRTASLVREARREPDVDVELWCVADERDPAPLERALRDEVCEVRLFPRSSSGPFARLARAKFERWFRSEALEHALRERLRVAAPDLVHVDEMSVLRSVPDTACPLVVGHPKLDLEFHRRTRGDGLAARFDRAKVARLEDEAARRARHHVVCSDVDRDLLLGRHPELVVHVVPNGFDESSFRPDPTASREDDVVLFLGSLDYEPNEDGLEFLVTEVLPMLRREVRVRVVGRNPSARVRRLAGGPVELVGEVADVGPYLASAAVLAVPLRIGGGTRLKIAEALATGTPVVSTRVGAEGLDLDERHLALADDAQAFARALESTLEDRDTAARRAELGRAVARERSRGPRSRVD
ncbi:MAG: glycosyltransferase family 4 protein [Planctomycetota bacterium]